MCANGTVRVTPRCPAGNTWAAIKLLPCRSGRNRSRQGGLDVQEAVERLTAEPIATRTPTGGAEFLPASAAPLPKHKRELVLEEGVEPPRPFGPRDFESRASASSATPATGVTRFYMAPRWRSTVTQDPGSRPRSGHGPRF